MKTSVCDESEIKCRWNNYNTYRILLWAWLMNEITVVAVPVDLSHVGFYMYLLLYVSVAIFVGIPLVYSEICIAQYTNCNVLSTWNFCPILRGVGYGTFYFVLLKIVYMMVFTSWYLEYTFYSAFDPPPWFTCDDFKDSKCMVKRVNVSVFQRCIESQTLFNRDCGMRTASSFFFHREIKNNNTYNRNCMYLWKPMLATFTICVVIFIILLKQEKVLKILVRVLAVYLFFILFVLCCVAVSSNGTWYMKVEMNWQDIYYKEYFYIAIQGVLACGIGSGVIGFLSRDVFFRSPATMTAVTVSLFSIFITLVLALILFNGIKTMSYFHGAENAVLEVDDNLYFDSFASVSEILSYYNDLPLWAFAWFSAIFLCLFVNTTILSLFLFELVTNNFNFTKKYKNISCMVLISVTYMLSCPFYCSDLTVVLTDVTEIIQLTSSFFFSVGIYWIYGFHKHNVDIIFMIGVKASYFWKIAWLTNPLWLFAFMYMKWNSLLVRGANNSYFIASLSVKLNVFLVYFLIAIYYGIIIFGVFIQARHSYAHSRLKHVFSPLSSWGPSDKILLRSRKMFVPEIMTREFLYRQVRIHGYSRRVNVNMRKCNDVIKEGQFSTENLNWSALTSN